MIDPPDTPTSPLVSAVTRRRFITGAFAVGTAISAGGVLSSSSGASADVRKLGSPGKALAPAERLGPPRTIVDFVVPDEGEILFPIVVGEDDYCQVLDNFADCRGNGCERLHEGVDIMAKAGLSIVSVTAGVITKRYDERYDDEGRPVRGGAGNGWTIHDEENDVVYKYFHMRSHSQWLDVGDRVEMGEIIGAVGETGTSGAGVEQNNFHLHFEYRPSNDAQDSFEMLQRDPNVTFPVRSSEESEESEPDDDEV